MSRNHASRTDWSVNSITDSVRSLRVTTYTWTGQGEGTGPTFCDETISQKWGPEQVLNRMLSTKTHIRIARPNRARDDGLAQRCQNIGQGKCGTVWSLSGAASSWVLKVMNDQKKDQLWNECVTHKRIDEVLSACPLELRRELNVPTFGGWINPSQRQFWAQHEACSPGEQKQTYALVSGRIQPVPCAIREALVDVFAPAVMKEQKASFLAMPENENCLVRLYLGRRDQRSAKRAFKLRNFDLMVNEMEYLRLDTELYATIMAKALAVLHWKVHVDGKGIEFVLGASPTVKRGATAAEYVTAGPDGLCFEYASLDIAHRSISIWLLDFSDCEPFPEDVTGVRQLQRAFHSNDPYYPRPESRDARDKALWRIFRAVYLRTSAKISHSTTPELFIQEVETEGRRRSGAGSLSR